MEEDLTHKKFKYMIQMQQIANKKEKAISITIEDLELHFRGDPAFVERVKSNTRRYISLFSDAIDQHMPPITENFDENADNDIYSIQQRQRQENIDAVNERLKNDNIQNIDSRH